MNLQNDSNLKVSDIKIPPKKFSKAFFLNLAQEQSIRWLSHGTPIFFRVLKRIKLGLLFRVTVLGC